MPHGAVVLVVVVVAGGVPRGIACASS